MIGNPKWFSRRKYSGWGLTPKTWQGWAYSVGMVLPIVLVLSMQSIGTGAVAFLVVWGVLFTADMVDIMVKLGRDERERIHEAIAERNALWTMLLILVLGLSYQAASSAVAQGKPEFDPFIVAAIMGALLVKMVSNFYLDRKD